MPLQGIPFGSDQVIVILSFVAAGAFWAACKLRDVLAGRKADREQVQP
jgi:hypothetical protein